MRIIKRIATAKQQADARWRSGDKWSREVTRELARLGYDVDESQTVKAVDDEPGRTYFTNVGARALTVVVTSEAAGPTYRILRVTIGRETFTARQAALWLHKRSPREKRYL